MTAGVTPGAAPVVVVETGAIAREVLREQHVGQVIAAGPKPRDADRVAIHRFVRHAAEDGEHANRRRSRPGAFDREERVHQAVTLIGVDARRRVQVQTANRRTIAINARWETGSFYDGGRRQDQVISSSSRGSFTNCSPFTAHHH